MNDFEKARDKECASMYARTPQDGFDQGADWAYEWCQNKEHDLDEINIDLNHKILELEAKLAKAVEALERIGDVTSAIHEQNRPTSFADWELRTIARDVLAQIRGDDVNR